MGTFRQFINNQNINFKIREEAAPSGGVSAAPTDPNNDSEEEYSDPFTKSFGKEFGIKSEDLDAAIEAGPISFNVIPDYYDKWGFVINPPIDVYVKKAGDYQYEVTFPFSDIYKDNPYRFIDTNEWRKGNYQYYQGHVQDEVVIMSKEELMSNWHKALEGGGAPMGGGGMPMGGGGMPPMGGM